MSRALPPPGALAPATPSAAAIGEVRALIAQQGDLIDALDKGAMRALLPALVDARNEMRQGLLAWLRTAPNGDERYTAQRHRKALLVLQSAIDRAVQLGHDVQTTLVDNGRAAGELSIRNLTEQVARFGEIFGETVTPIDLDTAALLAKGDKLRFKHYRTSAARYAGQVGEDIRHQLAVGVASNETFSQLKARLVKLGGPSGLVFTRGMAGDDGAVAEQIAEGLFRRHRYWAERLVRTELIEAYNQGHREGIGELNEHRDPATTSEYLKRWDSSLDKRICTVCRGLDRTVARHGGTFRGGYDHPPAHPNCRCVLVAWHASWGDIAGEIPPHETATQIAAMTPPVRPRRRARTQTPKQIAAAPAPTLPALPGELHNGTPQLEAVARGKWNDARARLEHDIAASEGYPRATLAVPNRPDADKVSVRKLRPGIGGLHHPHGRIDIERGRAEAAQRFARQWVADAEAVRRHLSEADAALAAGKLATPEQQRTAADAKCYRTLVHEVMHGHGPMLNRAYRGTGVLVEEVATEVTARRYMRQRFGLGPEAFTDRAASQGMGYNSYGQWIDHVTNSVASELNVPPARAREIMEGAADRYKRRASGSVPDDAEAVRAFGEDIAAEAGDPGAAPTFAEYLKIASRTRFR